MAEYQLKDSGVEWLGGIPEQWKIDRLKDVSRLRDKKTNTKCAEMDYLELEDIEQGTGRILSKRNTLNVASDVRCFFKGDVLFGKLRPYLAKYYLTDFDGKCTGEILAINPYRIEGAFLAYYVGSNHFINHCNNFSYGAKMPRINWNTQMGVFPVPIPPSTKEQKAIADYLDKACKQIDKTLEVKQQQLEKLESYRKSIIHEAVTKGLDKNVTLKDSGVECIGQIPEKWEIAKLKNQVFLKASNVDKKIHDDEAPVELCNYVDVYYNDYINNDISFMKATAKKSEITKFSIVPDDVIITKDSEDPMDIGVAALVVETKKNLLCGYHLTMLKKRTKSFSGAYLFWMLKDDSIASQLHREATGVTRWAISSRNIKNISIVLPKTKEQKAIADYLDKAREKIDQSKALIEQQIKTLTNYRKSLIHECVTGKKRVYFD